MLPILLSLFWIVAPMLSATITTWYLLTRCLDVPISLQHASYVRLTVGNVQVLELIRASQIA